MLCQGQDFRLFLAARTIIHGASPSHNCFERRLVKRHLSILFQGIGNNGIAANVLKAKNHNNQVSVKFRWSLLTKKPWAITRVKQRSGLFQVRLCLV